MRMLMAMVTAMVTEKKAKHKNDKHSLIYWLKSSFTLVNGDFLVDKEYYEKGITNIYISGGLGTNEYKYRLFNKPSFNLYRLKAQS